MKQLFYIVFLLFTLISCNLHSTDDYTDGNMRASLLREDGNHINFLVEVTHKEGQLQWIIHNGEESITIDDFEIKAVPKDNDVPEWREDSLIVQMPLFESQFRLQLKENAFFEGKWIKGTSTGEQIMNVEMANTAAGKYILSGKKPVADITGRWLMKLTRDSSSREAVAEFHQNREQLTGTVLTPTGDYRYLSGVVDGDTLKLSTFDGSHAYFFKAAIQNDSTLSNGIFASGATSLQYWTAVKNEQAMVPDSIARVFVKEGAGKLDFRFPDLDNKMVGIADPRFKDKVVVIQIMGSWCPNCMDETAFLADFYEKNKQRGIEMIALAYEYSTDFSRSQKSLRKFQKRFNIDYPMLITGVKTGDSLRTEKTLPQITPIKMFPTTIFVGKDGTIKSIHTGFNGPGTGEHYEQFKKEFNSTIDRLLKE